MKVLTSQQIQSGFDLLVEEYGYNQSDVLRKMETLQISLSPASFSNIINNRSVGKNALQRAGKGIQKIVASELGLELDHEKLDFVDVKTKGWQPAIISLSDQSLDKDDPGYIYHDKGRLTIPEKVVFMEQAKSEVVELGVRLNAFSNYFETRSEHEFKSHVTALLDKGVNFKIYMLDPNANIALYYFNDRAVVQPKEKKSVEVMKEVVERLRAIVVEYQAMDLEGKFELYFYKHIPYNHFLITDGERNTGNMLVSHYMYGIKRANAPVVEINKQKNRSLYRRYWKSYKYLTRDAKLLEV